MNENRIGGSTVDVCDQIKILYSKLRETSICGSHQVGARRSRVRGKREPVNQARWEYLVGRRRSWNGEEQGKNCYSSKRFM